MLIPLALTKLKSIKVYPDDNINYRL